MENNYLAQYKRNVYSQRGEDGILEKIFEILGITCGQLVDVGAYGLLNSNVANLLRQGWSGVLFESRRSRVEKLLRSYDAKKVAVVCVKIKPTGKTSLNGLLGFQNINRDFDFLNIDIDGNDYHVWAALNAYQPKVVVIEFNPEKKFDYYLQNIDGSGGCSLSAVNELAKNKGYKLIATTAFNAFFVRADLYAKFSITDNSLRQLWEENKETYG